MARNNLQKTEGQNFWIELGDGAEAPEAEVFTRIGLINTDLSAAFTQATSEESVPNLDNFDDPYDIVRTVISRDITFEGSGKIDARYIGEIMELHSGERAGKAVNLKFKMKGTGGFTITGPFILTNFSPSATYKEATTCQLSFVKAGDYTFTRNPA